MHCKIHLFTRARLWSLLVGSLCATSFILTGCSPKETETQSSNPQSPGAQASQAVSPALAQKEPLKVLWEDVAAHSGLSFKHDIGGRRSFHFMEITAPGCAFIDYDNDGYLDIFLVQSGPASPPSAVHNRPFCALFRNRGNGTFTDVTRGSGLDKDLGYGHGVAVGDYDNDGYDDLFLTSYSGNHLFRNRRGSGQWETTTQSTGLAKVHGTGYSTSAAWGDYDNDGLLDLYVCYYARWNYALDKKCRDKTSGQIDYCHPSLYDPVTHRLFRNAGRKFVDVSEKAGITKAKGRGLAVAFVDFNEDGRQDIFVANDVTPNMLWRNEGNGTFKNAANEAGVAYDGEGRGMASMGIAIADYDRSGHPSLYISNFSGYPNILFKNLGNGLFDDATGTANLATSHLKFLSFGCEFFDYDADGWPDIINNNGHVQANQVTREPGVLFSQRKQLLRNVRGIFHEITATNELGDLADLVIGRGLATGDYDNDGRLDVLSANQDAPTQLLRNLISNDHHWISFKTIGTKSNRNGIHARFEVKAGKARQMASVRGGSSYLSSSDRRVYFGLGTAPKVEQVIVHWPSGRRDVLKNLAADTFYTVTEGRGITSHARATQPRGDS